MNSVDLVLDRYLMSRRIDDVDLFDVEVQHALVEAWLEQPQGRRGRRRKDAAVELLQEAFRKLAFDVVHDVEGSSAARHGGDDGRVLSLCALGVMEALHSWDHDRGVTFRSWFVTVLTNLAREELRGRHGGRMPRSWVTVAAAVRDLALLPSDTFEHPGDRFSVSTITRHVADGVRSRMTTTSDDSRVVTDKEVDSRLTKDGIHRAVTAVSDIVHATAVSGLLRVDYASAPDDGFTTESFPGDFMTSGNDTVVSPKIAALLSLSPDRDVSLAYNRFDSARRVVTWRELAEDNDSTWVDVRQQVNAVVDTLHAPHAQWCALTDMVWVTDVDTTRLEPGRSTHHRLDTVLHAL